MLKILAFFITSFALSFWAINPVFAHVLESSGSIGAVMHVTPEDDPIAGEQSGFFFEFRDKTNRFEPNNCSCRIKIIHDNKELLSQDLFAANQNPSLDNASFFFVFPVRGIYTVQITGGPKSPEAFDEFTLEYDLRVSRTSQNQTQTDASSGPQNQPIALYIIGAIGVFFLALFIFKRIKKKNGKTALFSFFLLCTFLALNLPPLELFPHDHDGTEPPIHNKFTFVPKETSFNGFVVFEPVVFGTATLTIVKNKLIADRCEITPNNKSPPLS